MIDVLHNADIAQLVERNLAKVEVASSNLVVRSKVKKAIWIRWSSLLFRQYSHLLPQFWNRAPAAEGTSGFSR